MELYVGLDVSLKETSICVMDRDGAIVTESTVLSEPKAIAEYLAAEAPGAVRIGLESGPTSTWLWHELKARSLPVISIDARHAKAALAMQISKTDRNDAIGIARIMQTGWYREVQVKRLSCHEMRAALNSRALFVKIRQDVENQVRGLLKNFGLIIGTHSPIVHSSQNFLANLLLTFQSLEAPYSRKNLLVPLKTQRWIVLSGRRILGDQS